MKASLKLFGSALGQVVQQIERAAPAAQIARNARVLAASFALVAAGAAHANEFTDSGNAEPQRGTAPNVEAMAASAADSTRSAASSAMNMSRDTANAAARIGGGVLGGILGNKLVGNAGTLAKTVATLGGAFVGQALGNAAVPNNAAVTADSLRGPGGTSPGKADAEQYEQYRAAVKSTFAEGPVAGVPHALPPQIFRNVAHMMVDTAAARLVAVRALHALDEHQLLSATNGGKVDSGARSPQKSYDRAMAVYSSYYQSAHSALNLAVKTGYNVQSQATVFNTMPRELREEPKFALTWPGVEARAVQLGESAGMTASLAELHTSAVESATYVSRDRQR